MATELNLYRISYLYRKTMPDYKLSGSSSSVEKTALVVAGSDTQAAAFINSIKGNEVTGVRTEMQNVLVAPVVAPVPAPVPPPPPVPPAPAKV